MGCGSGRISLKSQSVFVLGATGTIGTATVNLLAAQKVNVTAGVRDPSKPAAQELKKHGAKLVKADMASDLNTLTQQLKGYDSIYVIAPGHIDRTNLALNGVKAAKAAGAKFVLVLSVSCIPETESVFGKQFIQLESQVKKLGINHAFIRLPLFTDNNLGMISTISKDGAIYAPVDGDIKFVTVTAQDAAAAAAKILVDYDQYIGQAITITSDKVSMNELADMFTRILNTPVKFVKVPFEGAKQAMVSAGYPAWQAEGINELYKYMGEGRASVVKESSDFKNLTNNCPISTQQWIKDNQHMFSPSAKQGIIVLGATGNIGYAAVVALTQLGARVTAGVRDVNSAKAKELQSKGALIVKADMSEDKGSLSKTLSNYNAVYVVTPGHIDRTKIVANVVAAAKEAKIDYLLVVSIPSAGYWNTTFGKQLGDIEDNVRTSGLNYGIIKLNNFIENYWGSVSTIKDHNTLYGPVDGKVVFTNISVEDAGLTAAKILLNYQQHLNSTYNPTSNTQTLEAVAEQMSAALGKKISYVNAGYDGFQGAMEQHGIPKWQAAGIVELYKLAEKGDKSQTTMTNHVQLITGKTPISNYEWMLERASAFK